MSYAYNVACLWSGTVVAHLAQWTVGCRLRRSQFTIMNFYYGVFLVGPKVATTARAALAPPLRDGLRPEGLRVA